MTFAARAAAGLLARRVAVCDVSARAAHTELLLLFWSRSSMCAPDLRQREDRVSVGCPLQVERVRLVPV